jgi:DnaJ-class molecular chaperone
MKVKVPPGVSSGSILRVTGEGDAGPRGYAIFIFIFDFLIAKVFGQLLD